jgi:hypothetical protein
VTDELTPEQHEGHTTMVVSKLANAAFFACLSAYGIVPKLELEAQELVGLSDELSAVDLKHMASTHPASKIAAARQQIRRDSTGLGVKLGKDKRVVQHQLDEEIDKFATSILNKEPSVAASIAALQGNKLAVKVKTALAAKQVGIKQQPPPLMK